MSVYNAGEEQGLLWIASRFVDGTDLRDALETHGRLGPALAGSLIEQVAGGLDTAHAEGIVHRDVKPASLLLSKDLKRAFLADVGRSKSMSKGSDVDNVLTQVGQFVGTVTYAAPEQNFAVGVDRVREIVPELAAGRSHAWTGALIQPFLVDNTFFGADAALVSLGAVPNSPAAAAGLSEVFVEILDIDGRPMDGSLPTYCDAVGQRRSGESAVFRVLPVDGGATREVTVGFG